MYNELLENGELSLSEILALAWKLYINNFKKIFMIVILVYIPINLIMLLLGDGIIQSVGWEQSLNLLRILENLIGAIATMGVIILVDSALQQEEMTYTKALTKSLSRWLTLIGTNILAGLILIFLFVLLIVPGIIWSVYYCFIVKVVALRNKSDIEALEYSKSLVKGRWWQVLIIISVIGLLDIVSSVIISLIPDIVNNLVILLVSNTLSSIVTAYCIVATTVFFLNLDLLENSRKLD